MKTKEELYEAVMAAVDRCVRHGVTYREMKKALYEAGILKQTAEQVLESDDE